MSERVRELEKHLDATGLPFGLRCAPMHVQDLIDRGSSAADAWKITLSRLGWQIDETGELRMRTGSRKDDVTDPMGGPTSRGEDYESRVMRLKHGFEREGMDERKALAKAVEVTGGYGSYARKVKNGIATAPAPKAEPVALATPPSALRRLSDLFESEVEKLTDAGKSAGDAYDAAMRAHPDLYDAYIKQTRIGRDGSRG